MEDDREPNTDIDDHINLETTNGWESLMNGDPNSMTAFAAHALRKATARDRIEQAHRHSKPNTPYDKRRKEAERKLGHIGASKLDIRDKTTGRQAIEQGLQNYGVNSADELDNIEYPYEEILSPEEVFKKYNKLFTFLGEDTKGNPNVVEKYQQLTDRKEQLRFILTSPLSDKVRLFCSENFDYPSYESFMQRLKFQQEFINGTAEVWEQEWDSRKGKYIDVKRPLNSSDASKDDILLGLNRASLKCAMIGTPEYGAYKMSIDIMQDRGWSKTPDFPEISGYWSGITDTSIGSWGTIIDEYGKIADKVTRTNPDLDEKTLEHITVRKAAKIFADSMEYNDNSRGPNSHYVSSFHESVAWAQLGPMVKSRLQGMRQNISDIDLRNIERFIGKSGYSQKRRSMESERSRLGNRIKYINTLSDDGKQEFLAKENAFEIKKQKEWREKEIERIKHKYEKLISETRSEERRVAYSDRQEDEIQRVIASTSERIDHYESRTLDGLFSDIHKRQELLSRQIAKRESLAEKAIDLHFKLGNGREIWDSNQEKYVIVGGSKYQNCLSWINEAPFGVIKRAHKRMVDGMSADEIYKLAISETIRNAVKDPDQADAAINQMFKDIEEGSSNARGISKITCLASKLSKYSEELSYSELESMSDKNTRWIEDSLAAFPLSDVKRFIDKGLNLSLVPKLRHIAKQYGYELDTDQLMELSSKRVINSYYYKEAECIFATALKDFSPDNIMNALDADIDLQILSKLKCIVPPDAHWDIEQFMKCAKVVNTTELCEEKAYEYMRDGLIDLDVLEEYPWLKFQYSNESCGGANVFPAKKSDNAKYRWCSDNSFVWLDGDWGRQTIGKIIYTRLQSEIEHSVHDATQWLNIFQLPETAYDIPKIKELVEQGALDIDIEKFSMRLFDKDEEKTYLARILSAPPSIRNRLNLSIKPQNMSMLFSSPEHIFIYSELAKVLKSPEIDYQKFKKTVMGKMEDYYADNIINSDGKNSSWRMTVDDFGKKVSEAVNDILQTAQAGNNYTDRIGDVAQRLKQYGLNRRTYIDDATSWLVKHTVSPQQTLVKAWPDRALAIASGIKDTASDICSWVAAESIVKTQKEFFAENGISTTDLLTTYKPFVNELTRCYSDSSSARAIVEYKRIHRSEKLLPAAVIPLEINKRKFTGEILAHDDPRGMTIGYDTGCCMTVDGFSHSCIESGYRDPGAGFFAFYNNDNRLNAQSYFFTDPDYPEVVVMDNIEANSGRDSDRIIEVYQEFFRRYLKDRFANDPNWRIRQVNVGTRYGEVAKAQVRMLKSTEIVPNKLSSYSDAREDQRILLRLSDDEIAEARSNGQNAVLNEKVKPDHSPVPLASPLGINQLPILQSLEAQLYPENMLQYDDNDFAYQELTMPGMEKYSFLINIQEDATNEADGYCLAYEDNSRTDPNYPDKVVYIADFGILPNARGGMAALKAFNELLRRIDENGIKKVEMDARESTSYRLLNSDWGRRYLASKGYDLVEHDTVESFGNNETTHLLSLEKRSQ